MIIALSLLAAGFVLLIKGADALVSGSSSLARRYGISNLLIGLTVVAFGTSMPELTVEVFAAFRGSPGIVLGNNLGSNIANIGLVLGLAAVFAPLTVQRTTVWKEIPLALLASALAYIMANDSLLDGRMADFIGRGDGLVLLSFFVIFLYYVVAQAMNGHHVFRHEHDGKMPTDVVETALSTRRSLLTMGLGLLALVLGGNVAVDGAMRAALALGISNRVIGLTIVAIGTSLPELATSIVAVYRKNADIAVGNIVGSNIFNVFFILGTCAVIRQLPASPAVVLDMIVAMAMTGLLFAFMFVGRRHVLERWQGILLVASYAAYVGYLITSA